LSAPDAKATNRPSSEIPPEDDGPVEPPTAEDRRPAGARPTASGGQADFYVKLGQRSLRGGDTDAAAESFQKARSFDGRNVDALVGLGQVALKKGEWNAAVVHLEAASRLSPSSVRLHVLRGQAHMAAGEKDAAISAFKKALSLDPNNAAAAEGYRLATGG